LLLRTARQRGRRAVRARRESPHHRRFQLFLHAVILFEQRRMKLALDHSALRFQPQAQVRGDAYLPA
jgi:hypothetical protein